MFAAALQQIAAAQAAGQVVDPFEHVALLTDQGRLLARSGQPDPAMALFQQVQALETQRGHARNVAVIAGDIADILQARGE